MNVRVYVGLTFIIYCTYFCIANVTQQHAVIQWFDERYVSEARAFTSRRRRGDAYLTNVTIVTRVGMDNNVTVKIIADLNAVGRIVFHEMKICDGFKISWIRQITETYSNFTECPIPAGRYQVYNLEIPPKNFPLPVPKGEGTLHLYGYLTRNMQLVFHGLMKVVSS